MTGEPQYNSNKSKEAIKKILFAVESALLFSLNSSSVSYPSSSSASSSSSSYSSFSRHLLACLVFIWKK